jgi:hypothetical protein
MVAFRHPCLHGHLPITSQQHRLRVQRSLFRSYIAPEGIDFGPVALTYGRSIPLYKAHTTHYRLGVSTVSRWLWEQVGLERPFTLSNDRILPAIPPYCPSW